MKMKPNKTIPKHAGVYLFKDTNNQVIYIGKAKDLKARINSYFQKFGKDWKIDALLEEQAEIDWVLTNTEHEALLLEAQLVKEHKPKYNVLLRDGQPFVYIMISQEPLPELKIVRNKKEKGTYFGPFIHKRQARGVCQFLIETFKLRLCNKKIPNGCLDFHIGLCAGSCMTGFDPADYQFRIDLAIDALKEQHATFIKKLKEKISEYNKQKQFEKSKRLTEYVANLDLIFDTLKSRFSYDKYSEETVRAFGLTPAVITPETQQQLQAFLQVDKPIITIDCFDISHFQSQYIVGSCIRFTNGLPDKDKFRRFKIKSLQEQNDYAALQEIVTRRYKKGEDLPDLILIDGGKGQLNAVKDLYPQTLFISLAKREETIFAPRFPQGKKLDIKTSVGKLLISLRDYAHHFAISYHRLRRSKNFKDQ